MQKQVRMNKKGIFMPLLAVFTLIIFSWTYYTLVFGAKNNYNEKIGQNEFMLYEQYMEGEKIFFYVDESVRQAAYNSIIELANNGGYGKDEISGCGNAAGYNLWYNNGKECMPKDLKTKFLQIFKNKFDNYLGNYQIKLLNKEETGLQDVFDIEITDSDDLEITGKSKEKYVIGNQDAKYSISPDFRQEIAHNFNDYNEIKVLLNDPLRSCRSAECFNRFIKQNNYDWQIVDRDDYVLFNVDTKKKIFNQQIVIKFAILKN